MAPEQQPQPQAPPAPAQCACRGWLRWQQAAAPGDAPGVSCWGHSSAVQQHHDLTARDAARVPPAGAAPGAGVELVSLSCVGTAVWQAAPDAEGKVPPPWCLEGVEMLRYAQSLHQQQQRQQQQQPLPAVPVPAATGVLPPRAAAMREQAGDEAAVPQPPQQQQQQDEEAPAALGGRPSLLARAQQLREEAHERLGGEDATGFARAFARRAALNLQQMRALAGEVWTAARADLGLPPPPAAAQEADERAPK